MSNNRLFLLFVLVFVVFFGSCGSQYEMIQAQLEQDEEKQERYEEGERIIEKARQEHYDMQTPEARKRMKVTARKSKKWNNRDAPFYVRWYWAVVFWFR